MSTRLFCIFLFFAALPGLMMAQGTKIPPFRMMQADHTIFKAEQLPKGKPVIIIYFSPDCDHCQAMVTEMLGRINDFKSATIAMVTYLSPDEVAGFVKTYNLAKYPNIVTGTEGNSYFLRDYYRVAQMPFLALYNKNGDLLLSYSRQIPLDEVKNKLAQLK